MLDQVLSKTGEGAANAVGAGGEAVAGGYINFMLSPWGLGFLVIVLLIIRAVR